MKLITSALIGIAAGLALLVIVAVIGTLMVAR